MPYSAMPSPRRIRNWLLPLLAVALLTGLLSVWEDARLVGDAEGLSLARARELANGLEASVRLAARAEQTVREVLEDQLFAAARYAARVLADGEPPDWPRLLREGGVGHFDLLDGQGRRIACSDAADGDHPAAALDPGLLAGTDDQRSLGLLRQGANEWLAVAVAMPGGPRPSERAPAVLVAGIDAGEWRALQGALGVGGALQRMTRGGSVRLALVVNSEGVLAASGPLPDDLAPLGGPEAPFAEGLRRLSGPSGGVETVTPLGELPGAWLRLVVDDGPERALVERGRLFLWLRSLALVALAGAFIAWRGGRQRLAELERERVRVTAEVRRLEGERAETERLRALGQMAGAVAHEIRNPLNTASIAAQRLQREFRPQADEAGWELLLDALRRELARIEERVAGFLEFARPPKAERGRRSLRPLLEELASIYGPRAEAAGHRFVLEAGLDRELAVDAGQLRQALVNLLENALQALERAGRPGRLRLALEDAASGGAALVVEDDGPGVPEAERERIFELYHTSRPEGSGLGLPLARRVAREHGGRLTLEDGTGGGARFRLEIDGAGA